MNIKRTKNLNIFLNLIVLFILFFNILFLTACNNEINDPLVPDYDYTVFPEDLKGLIKDKKIYFTSIGQSKDIDTFKIIVLDNLENFEYILDRDITINEIDDNSVVFVFVGCSVKALGESGTSIEDELERTSNFMKQLEKKKITMIGLHTGGQARRGSTSNQFIESVFSNSSFNIFVESGNFDGMLTSLSVENAIPCYQIINVTELINTMKLLSGDE